MRTVFFKTFFVLFLGVLFALQVNGQKTLEDIVKRGELRVGMSGNQPPYTMQSKSGKLIGYEVDLATGIAESMGVKLSLVQMPFPELLGALEAGKVDIVMSGMTITMKRNMDAIFIGPYSLTGKSILTKSSVLAKVESTDEVNLPRFKLTYLEGSTSETFVKTYMPEAELVPVDNYDDGVSLVLEDMADAMVADFPICAISVLRHSDRGLITLDEPLTMEPIGLAISPGDPQFQNLLENYFSALDLSGLLMLLEEKWFEDGTWLLQVK